MTGRKCANFFSVEREAVPEEAPVEEEAATLTAH